MERSIDGTSSLPAHFPTLDGLRGVAIVLVVSHQLNRLTVQDLLTWLADHVLVGGWTGVQLFFVLSGFLISGILLDSRDSPSYYRTFYIRRVLRIFPIYYGALLLFVIVLPGLGILPPAWRDHQIWLWIYLSNWSPYIWTATLSHFWSLAVEEQFYLLWPLLVHSRTPRELLRLCAGLAVVSLLARVAMVVAGVPTLSIYENSIARLDALVAGGAVAALLRMPGWLPRIMRTARPRFCLPVFCLGAMGLVTLLAYRAQDPFGQTVGYSLLSMMFALVIMAAACSDAAGDPPGACARLLRSAPMRALGKYSYAMYIFHKPMSDLLGDPLLKALGYPDRLPPLAQMAYLVAADTAVLIVGMLSYWLVERHFLRLKRRFAAEPEPKRAVD
jgi:peptidoglycan/LPS O-acetylase OafA/YrhL